MQPLDRDGLNCRGRGVLPPSRRGRGLARGFFGSGRSWRGAAVSQVSPRGALEPNAPQRSDAVLDRSDGGRDWAPFGRPEVRGRWSRRRVTRAG